MAAQQAGIDQEDGRPSSDAESTKAKFHPIPLLRTLEAGSSGVYSVAFSPDGRLLASSSEDGTLRLWNVGRLSDVYSTAEPKVLHAYRRGANAVTFSPDGAQLALAGDDGMLQLWDATTIAPPPKGLSSGEESILAVAFSPNGRLLASAHSDGPVCLWEIARAAEREILRGHEGPVFSVAFSPDGDLLASGSDDRTVRLWDLAGTAEPRVLRGHDGMVLSVAFSPIDRLLASSSEDGTVRLWDLAGTARPRVLRGHEGLVRAVAFSPDGSLVASASHDGTMRLWDVSSASETEVLAHPEGDVRAVAFSPDGRLLASASYSSSGPIWLWNTTALGIGPTLDLGRYRAVVEADTTRGVDALGVEADARSFARLIMDREVEPPLAIGVFGEWGSGKSFFMDRLREQIGIIAKTESTGFCHNVVAIEFNAWHYVEANLWASLVHHIFDQLDQHISGEGRKKALFERLETTKQLKARAEEDKRRAEAERTRLIELLKKKRAEKRRHLDFFHLLTGRFLRSIPFDQLPEDTRTHLEELRGQLDEPIDSALELWEQVEESRSIAGRVHGFWRALREQSGLYQSCVVFAVIAFVVLVAALSMGWVDWLGSRLTQASVSFVLVLTGIGGFLRWANNLVSSALSIAEHIRNQLVHDSEAEVDALDAELRQTELKIEEAGERLSEAELQLSESALPRRIARFIEERVAGGNYAEHLGIVATVRRDFEALSDLLAPNDSDVGGANAERDGLALAAEAKDPPIELPDIERIVLYIDDLDRCPTPRVVQVLEAIHLLLAFPLFVVVVGVDVRWTQRSLLDHYPRHLANSGSGPKLMDAQTTSDQNVGASELEDLATPHDYLEKIFQIPFWLQRLEGSASRRLLASLIEARTVEGRAGIDEAIVATESGPDGASAPSAEISETEVQEQRDTDRVSRIERSSGTARQAHKRTDLPSHQNHSCLRSTNEPSCSILHRTPGHPRDASSASSMSTEL